MKTSHVNRDERNPLKYSYYNSNVFLKVKIENENSVAVPASLYTQ